MIRISGIVKESIVDGPGLRYTIFTQGCPHRCEGCHNPHTFDFNGGYEIEIKEILSQIDSNPLLSGVTFSGGEPVSQIKALLPLARAIKERGLSIILYSGYLFEEILLKRDGRNFLSYVDILVDGRFEIDKRSLELDFKGSKNQRVIDVAKSIAEDSVVIYDFSDMTIPL